MLKRLGIALLASLWLIVPVQAQQLERETPSLAQKSNIAPSVKSNKPYLLAQVPANLPAPILNRTAAFSANAIDFDGSNDWLERGANFTSIADSSQGILSFWFRLDGGDGANQRIIISATSNGFRVIRNTANKFTVQTQDIGGVNTFNFATVATWTAGATWVNFLSSWDANFTAGNKIAWLYMNDSADVTVTSDTGAAFNIDYATGTTNWGVFGNPGGGLNLNGCIANVYFAAGQYLDFSVVGNRRKFISSTGKAVNLGATGTNPTGVAPTLLLTNPTTTFPTNLGTGGGMTLSGALDACSTSPN